VHVVGDSTGAAATYWPGLWAAQLGQAYQTHRVLHRLWSAANQTYSAPTVVQNGPDGETRAAFASGGARFTGSAITGDIDVRVKCAPTQWGRGAAQALASRWQSSGSNLSWWFGLSTSGVPVFTWTTSGASGTQIQKFATTGTGYPNGQVCWLRATLDVDNGASGNTVTFYTSLDGATWTQLGAPVVTAGVTSIFAGTASYQIGCLDVLGSVFVGDLYWVEARSGIGDGGYSVIPPLPDMWDQFSSTSSNTITRVGSPTLLMVNGGESSRNVAYWEDPTRKPRVWSPHRPQLIILNNGHNEGVSAFDATITATANWLSSIRALYPHVPIVLLSQNGQYAPRTANDRAVAAARRASLLTVAAAVAGVYPLDVAPAITDPATQMSADGLHPTVAGQQAWAAYLHARLTT
jgi:lysophospholipase L1-like esterase